MTDKQRPKRGVGRVWLAVAAIGGAVTAFLADPVRGTARRQVAVDRVRSAFNSAADRTQRWRRAVADRTSKASQRMTTLRSVSRESGPNPAGAEPQAAPQETGSKPEPKHPES